MIFNNIFRHRNLCLLCFQQRMKIPSMTSPYILYCLYTDCFLQMAGAAGIEPTRSLGLEPSVLPLYYAPMARMAGLEPATPALTARRTTIVLHPNCVMLSLSFRIHTVFR